MKRGNPNVPKLVRPAARYAGTLLLLMRPLRAQGLTAAQIAARLNAQNVRTFTGKPWTRVRVQQVLGPRALQP